MNRMTIHGNITRDVESDRKGDTRYAKFTVASDRSTKPDSATDYFAVVAFGEVADAIADLAKGEFVEVTGFVRLGRYNDRPTIEVVAKRVERKAREEAA